MATTPLASPPSSLVKTRPTVAAATATSLSFSTLPLHPLLQFQYPKLSSEFLASSLPHWLANKAKRGFSLFAVVDQEGVVAESINGQNVEENDEVAGSKPPSSSKASELYVCNLPRSCDISELVEMFKPFGTVMSVEVSKNPETGISKGCGYVTMGSLAEARKAIQGLDGSDVGGREMRVRFSVDVDPERRSPNLLNSGPINVRIYESPHKLYVGNFAWTVKPEELRNHFSRFGTVVSARVLSDRKRGKNRTYAFISFSTAAERDAALSLNGSEFYGRVLVVKKGVEKGGSN